MTTTRRTILTGTLLVLLLGLAATPAAASTKKEASYAFERVWPAAVRFLRIDEGLEILEKDRDSGYVLFELAEDRKTFRGALEVVQIIDQDGRAAVRLVLRIEDRPSYMEAGILDRMVRKLRAELGPPVDPPPPPPPAKPAKPTTPDDGGAKQ
ncbi:MAG TPA: hypothetical protein VML75_03645 [Kofleriaceae bacterium]|nr:hypothetical protein [Kofleriaceae bacterium]